MNYVIDYNNEGALAIKGMPSEPKTPVVEGLTRAIVRNEAELGELDPALLFRIANFKSKAMLETLPPVSDIWAMLSPPPKAKPAKLAKAKKTAEKIPTEKQNKDLIASPDAPMSGSTEGTAPTENKPKESKMAKAKKNGKATKAKKGSAVRFGPGGAPREGTKAAKLLALISRKDGATFAEMKAATGWKEMRGTALVLAARVGKKLTSVKAEGKATRWVAA